MRTNCWEFMKCGRQPGGVNNNEFGICPVSIERLTHGVNNGVNGGRACWAIMRKLNDNAVRCAIDQKSNGCLHCEFYSKVRSEEGENFVPATEILATLRS